MKKILLILLALTFIFTGCSHDDKIYENNTTKIETSRESEDETTEEKIPEYTGPCKGTFDGGFSWIYDKESGELKIKGKGVFPIPLFDIFQYQIVVESSDCRVDPWNRIEYPSRSLIKTLHIEDGITAFSDKHPVELENGKYFSTEIGTEVENLIVGKDLSDIPVSVSKAYSVSTENPYFASYDKSLYTKDYRKLLYRPSKQGGALKLHPNLEIVGDGALSNTEFDSAKVPESVINGYVMVIPWGVTTIEGTLTSKYDMQAVIVPDTLRNFDSSMDASWYNATYFVSQNHYDYCVNKYAREVNPFEKVLDESYVDRVSNLSKKDYYDYYDITPNSFKTFQNGKTYYFDGDYKMAVGWTEIDGNRYYFGEDGAMYKDCKTPDGYYVNSNGVWVQ